MNSQRNLDSMTLAMELDMDKTSTKRGAPQLSPVEKTSVEVSTELGSNRNNIETGSTENTNPWSPGRQHGAKNNKRRRFRQPENYNNYINIYNKFNILEQEEFLILDRTQSQHANMNEERFFLALRGKSNIQRKDISELRGGNLLIKTRNSEDSKIMKETTSVLQCNCEIKPHPKLNQVQGTIYSTAMLCIPAEDLKQDWINQGFKVKEVYRFTRKVDDITIPTPKLLITFDGLSLPEGLWHGWTYYSIRPYIPNPKRCYKCNKFGHVGKFCRAQNETCVRCGQSMDSTHDIPCQKPPKCLNCGENHQANDRKCKKYIMEKEIITHSVTQKCSFREAREAVQKKYGSFTKSFAEVTKSAAVQNVSGSFAEAIKSAVVQDVYNTPTNARKTTSLKAQNLPNRIATLERSPTSNKRVLTESDSSVDRVTRTPKPLPKIPRHHSPVSEKVVITVEADVHQDSSQSTQLLVSPLQTTKAYEELDSQLAMLDGGSAEKPKQPPRRRKSLTTDYPMPPLMDYKTKSPRAICKYESPKPRKHRKETLFEKKIVSKTPQKAKDFLKDPKPDIPKRHTVHLSDPRKRQISTIITDREK